MRYPAPSLAPPALLALLALPALSGCVGGDPDMAPSDAETSADAVTALLPREGLAYLAGRALAERPELRELTVTVDRAAIRPEEGGTIIHGPSEGVIPIDSVRLEPDQEGAALIATARLGPADLAVPILRRPKLGAPEQCHLRMTSSGGLATVVLLPAATPGRELQAAGVAELDLQDAELLLDEGCPEPVPAHAAELGATLRAAIAAAVARHLTEVAQVAASAAGPGQALTGGKRIGAGLLRATVAPSGVGSTIRVRREGIARVYDAGVDARLEGDDAPCAPAPVGDLAPPAPSPSPPPLAPGGAAYRLALAIDGAFLDRALSWAAASGAACQDDGPEAGLSPDDVAKLPGVASIVTEGRPLRSRLRPAQGVRTSLRPDAAAPLRLTMRELGLAVYGEVDGAPLAFARLQATVDVDATVELTEAGDLVLSPVGVTVTDAVAKPTVLPEGVDGVLAAAESLYEAAIRTLLSRRPLPLQAWTDRPAELVAVEATESHLMIYFDLR